MDYRGHLTYFGQKQRLRTHGQRVALMKGRTTRCELDGGEARETTKHAHRLYNAHTKRELGKRGGKTESGNLVALSHMQWPTRRFDHVSSRVASLLARVCTA